MQKKKEVVTNHVPKTAVDIKQLMEDPEKGREFIRNGLTLDLKAAIYSLNVILQTPEMLDAYVAGQWRRYVAFYEKEKEKEKQMKIDLAEPNGVNHGE